MDPFEFEAAKASIRDTLEWRPSSIMIDLRKYVSGEKITIDLASLIKKPLGNGKGLSSDPELLMYNCNHIPFQVFDGATDPKERKKKVTGYLQNACRPAGFSIVAGRTNTSNHGRIKKHRYHCPRYRHKENSKVPDSERKRNRTSGRPTCNEPCCTFNFTICEDTSSNMFFFPAKEVAGDLNHIGHQKVPPPRIPVSTDALPSVLQDTQTQYHKMSSQLNDLTAPSIPNKRAGTYAGNYPSKKTSLTTAANASFKYTVDGQEHTGIYYLPSYTLVCSGCGYIPESPFKFLAFEQHCFGHKDRGGCPAFMAKHYAFLDIKKGWPRKKKKEDKERPPGSFYYATNLETWGTAKSPSKVLPEGAPDQAFWEKKFSEVIEQNKRVGYAGWSKHLFQPVLGEFVPLSDETAAGYAKYPIGITMLREAYGSDAHLQSYIRQVQNVRLALGITFEEDNGGSQSDDKRSNSGDGDNAANDNDAGDNIPPKKKKKKSNNPKHTQKGM